MPSKKNKVKLSQLKGIKLYNFLLKQVGEANKKSKSKQQLGIQSRRKIVSEQLYPKFKSAPKVTLTEIRKNIQGVITALPPKEICNPLFLPESQLVFIEYYAIDEHIRNVLPDCLDVRVNAGRFGKTKIFNTRGYLYQAAGVRKIVENIRDEVSDNKSGRAYFDGIVKLKYNRPNDGNPNNYFVDFVLFINSKAEADDTILEFDIPDKEKKKVKEISNVIAGRMNKLQRQRAKRKRAAKKASPKEKKKKADIDIRNAINSYRNLLKAKIISKQEFEKKKAELLSLKKRP